MDDLTQAHLSIEEALERSHALRAAGERLIREADALRVLVKAAVSSGDLLPKHLDPITFPETASSRLKTSA
jgi:hypothetical protein